MITAEELKSKLSDWHESLDSYDYFSWQGELFDRLTTRPGIVQIGEWTLEHMDNDLVDYDPTVNYYVFKLGEQYFKVWAFYNSWEGTLWSEAEVDEVTPEEKTITVWNRK